LAIETLQRQPILLALPLALGLALAPQPGCTSSPQQAPAESGTGGKGGNRGTGGAAASGGKSGQGGGTAEGGSGGSAVGSGGQSGGAAGTGGVTGTGGADAGGSGGNAGQDAAQGGNQDGGPSGAGGGGSPSSGAHFKMIKLDTTTAGAGVMVDVAKYPVAVVLNTMNFDFTQAKAKGEDVRFVTAEGVALPFEIEFWDAAAKVAGLWVKVDLKGNAAQSIKMTWGDSAATAASNPNAVFDTKEGFIGVWHLSEPGSTTADGYKDATASAAHATGVALAPASTGDGRVGKATLLSHATGQFIQVPAAKSTIYDMTEKMTYSIWFNAKTRNAVSYQGVFTKGEGSFRLHFIGTTNATECCIESTIHNDICAVGKTEVATGKWYHMMAVHDRPNIYYYLNGKLEAMDDEPAAWKSDPTKPVTIGTNSSSPAPRSFDGSLDEARILNVVKDANWAKLEYESQREGQTFLTFGDGM
jgi:hypothetical protein